MKKIVLLIVMVLSILSIHAQRPAQGGEIAEKIEAQKVAFITKMLDLTPAESQKFWPLYNEFSAKERELRPEFPPEKPGKITEKEANELIDQFFADEEKRLNLTRNYYQKFKEVLPASKVVKLHFAERKFREKLLEKMKERREKMRMD